MKEYGINESERVPAALQDNHNAITVITDEFCLQHLNEEYRDFCRRMAAKICRKRPSPITKGKPNTWACGIVYALGRVNFLFDKSKQPYISSDEMCAYFGLSKGTGAAKSKAIMKILDIGPIDPHWTLPSRMNSNPMVWMILVNGIIVDARHVSREIQEEAFRRGMIPFLP